MNIISVTNEAFAPYLPLCGGDTLFLCAPGRYALGAQENGRAAGLLLYTLSETGAVLNRLAWSQNFSEDVGRALLEAFWERLQEQDCFLASALLGEEEHEQLGGILTQAGFFPMREEGRCWEFPVGSLHLGGVPAKNPGLLSLEEAYVPQDLVPNLPDVDLNVFTLHQVYAFYGIRLARGEQSLSISRLDAAEARLLDVDPHRGVLTLQCVNYDDSGRAVEFTRTHIRGDKCELNVRFQREV